LNYGFEQKMSASKPIRVMIVDDHGMVRRGLAAYMLNDPGIEVIAEASNGQEAIHKCENDHPEVILMDLVMPEMSGVAATRIIHQRWPEIQIIALTSYQEKELVKDALQAGAISYLLKNVSGEDLAETIRAAHAGRRMLSKEAVDALIQSDQEPVIVGRDLTLREREVLNYLVKGMTNPEIAQQLSVSRSTVKAHVSSILSKLGASNRAEAIAFAIEHKLVD
jgi:NarL family two-component system response regulator LiaR